MARTRDQNGQPPAHRQGRRPAARFRFHDFSTGVLNTFSQVGNFLIAKADAGICDSKGRMVTPE